MATIDVIAAAISHPNTSPRICKRGMRFKLAVEKETAKTNPTRT